MADRSTEAEEGAAPKRESWAELRTIAFRLRELQRLFSMRVEQENRRLEQEGIEPVTDDDFQRQVERRGRGQTPDDSDGS